MGSDIVENDVISLFLNRKIQNISRYTEIFVKYTLKGNVKLHKIINKIIEIYIYNFYLNTNEDYSLLMKYFEVKKTKESLMKDVLSSSLLFYRNSGLEKQIEGDINTIVILSNLIYLALNFDKYTNEFNNASLEIEDRINNFFKHFKDKIKLEDNEQDFLEELKIQVKKDSSAEKKFWKCLINKNFFLQYYRVIKNNNLFLVDYNYDIKMLNRYDKREVNKTRLTKGINDDILTIYLEMLSIFILKDLLSNHFHDYFFINIYADYFNKNKNMTSIENIYNSFSIKKHLVFVFSYDEIKANMSSIKTLHAKGFKLAVTNINNDVSLSTTTFDLFDFVFISSDLYDKYERYHDVWNIKKINFAIDHDQFIMINEDKILTEVR